MDEALQGNHFYHHDDGTTIPIRIGLHQPSRLQTPVALQAATAIEAKVAWLITSDPNFKRVEGIEVFVFEEFV